MVWTGGSQGDLAPAIEALFDHADELWPDRSKASDGTLGDTSHASRSSDHNPKDPNPPGWVDAGDLTYDPAHGVDLFDIAERIRLRRDRRVKYVIFFGRVFKSYVDSAGRPAWEWQPYTGLNAHKSHMHVSVTSDGRADTSPWFTQEDDLMALSDDEQRELLSRVRAMHVGGWVSSNGEGDLSWLEAKLAPVRDQIAGFENKFLAFRDDSYVNYLLIREGHDDGDLSDEQVQRIIAALPDAVKRALREGVG